MLEDEIAELLGELRATQTAVAMLIGILGKLAAGETKEGNPLLD